MRPTQAVSALTTGSHRRAGRGACDPYVPVASAAANAQAESGQSFNTAAQYVAGLDGQGRLSGAGEHEIALFHREPASDLGKDFRDGPCHFLQRRLVRRSMVQVEPQQIVLAFKVGCGNERAAGGHASHRCAFGRRGGIVGSKRDEIHGNTVRGYRWAGSRKRDAGHERSNNDKYFDLTCDGDIGWVRKALFERNDRIHVAHAKHGIVRPRMPRHPEVSIDCECTTDSDAVFPTSNGQFQVFR
ncbi:hypothetical protein BLA18112_03167 [Burkholderia lata]|uniref:Uncharacterized protein n=1 Tax=Burkholderia lata (strain ATCC 17760 / DSM 23089 / LMG 22485 / NCIMB 9086 / R18194 / 383) TaxID=482957 RepID=A0A6P2WBP7_BURL3|nr:hypothetical protein BLA18112_03167 [Burkholderia lata]